MDPENRLTWFRPSSEDQPSDCGCLCGPLQEGIGQFRTRGIELNLEKGCQFLLPYAPAQAKRQNDGFLLLREVDRM